MTHNQNSSQVLETQRFIFTIEISERNIIRIGDGDIFFTQKALVFSTGYLRSKL
jgi:hypothetical protein